MRFLILILLITHFATGCTHKDSPPAGNPTAAGPSLTKIDVTIKSSNTPGGVCIGTIMQLQATGTYSDNSTADISAQVTWSSSDTAAFAITGANGNAQGTGSVDISASLAGVKGTLTIAVHPGPTGISIQVAPSAKYAFVPAGVPTPLQVVLQLGDATTLPLPPDFSGITWTLDASTTGSITADGVLTDFSANQKAGVSAQVTFNGQTLSIPSASLDIKPPIPVALSFAPLLGGFGPGSVVSVYGTFSDGTTSNVTNALASVTTQDQKNNCSITTNSETLSVVCDFNDSVTLTATYTDADANVTVNTHVSYDTGDPITATLPVVNAPGTSTVHGSPSVVVGGGSLIFATVPQGSASQLGPVNPGATLTSGAITYSDARATFQGASGTIGVKLSYSGTTVPAIYFLNPKTMKFEPIVPSATQPMLIDTANKTITLYFDSTSVPALKNLAG